MNSTETPVVQFANSQEKGADSESSINRKLETDEIKRPCKEN